MVTRPYSNQIIYIIAAYMVSILRYLYSNVTIRKHGHITTRVSDSIRIIYADIIIETINIYGFNTFSLDMYLDISYKRIGENKNVMIIRNQMKMKK
jgi:hypothetical protein